MQKAGELAADEDAQNDLYRIRKDADKWFLQQAQQEAAEIPVVNEDVDVLQ